MRKHQIGPFEIEWQVSNGCFDGITSITHRGFPLRNASRPLRWTAGNDAGTVFRSWRLIKHAEESASLQLTLEAAAQTALESSHINCYGDPIYNTLSMEPMATAQLLAEIRHIPFAGHDGLEIQLTVRSPDLAITWIGEQMTFELGGDTTGSRYFAQRWGCENGGWDASLDREDHFSTEDAMCINGQTQSLGQFQPRAGGGPSLDFIYSGTASLALARGGVSAIRGFALKPRGTCVMDLVDRHLFRPCHEAATNPLQLVESGPVIDRADAANRWATLWDEHVRQISASTGIARPTALPAAFCESWNLGSGRFFDEQERRLQPFADLGVKRVLLHTLPHPHEGSNCCGLFDYSILETEGGMERLRQYTDKAHALGIEVIGWTSGHLHRSSPLIQANPDWAVHNRDGSIFGGGYKVLAALDFSNPNVQAFYTQSVLDLAQKGGIDGIWADSLLNLHFYGVNRCRSNAFGGPGPHVDGLMECFRILSEAGLILLTEGISPFGLSAGSIGSAEIRETAWTGNLQLGKIGGLQSLYRTQLWARGESQAAGRGISPEVYFQSLAHAAPLAIYYNTSDDGRRCSLPPLPEPPCAIDGFASMNRDYLEALPFMGTRTVLGKPGIYWAASAEQDPVVGVFFSCAEGPAPEYLLETRATRLVQPGQGTPKPLTRDTHVMPQSVYIMQRRLPSDD